MPMTLDQVADHLEKDAESMERLAGKLLAGVAQDHASASARIYAAAAAACREAEKSRELLSPRGASVLADIAANIPTFSEYGRARRDTDRSISACET